MWDGEDNSRSLQRLDQNAVTRAGQPRRNSMARSFAQRGVVVGNQMGHYFIGPPKSLDSASRDTFIQAS